MALVASELSLEPRAWSIGPVRMQVLTFSVASGDTTGTATATNLTNIEGVIVTGVVQTAAPTFSGNVITLAFVDPAATRYGQIIVLGT